MRRPKPFLRSKALDVSTEVRGASNVIAKGGCSMKFVVIGQPSGASMDAIMAVYPRHKAVVDAFVARGEVIGIGPFADRGNMAIFRTRDAAEAFTKQDPFILEGLVKSIVIREWNDSMLKLRTTWALCSTIQSRKGSRLLVRRS